jgi:hypothetical protein
MPLRFTASGRAGRVSLIPPAAPSYASAYSLRFDGSDDFLNNADSNGDYNFGNATTDSPFSISTWFRADTIENFRIACKGADASNREWLWTTDPSGKLTLSLYDLVVAKQIVGYYNSVLSTDTWYHGVCTYDGSSTVGGIKLYLNGSSVTVSQTTQGAYTAMHDTGSDLEVGRWHVAGYADGYIDEMAIWSSVLSAAEVTAIYGTGKPPFDLTSNNGDYASSGNLIGYWKMETGSGTSAVDSSTNENNLTFNSAPTWETEVAS